MSLLIRANRSHFAAAASGLAGLTTAAGIVAIHLAPRWSEPVGDPYWELDPNALSWALMAAPLLAASASQRSLRASRCHTGKWTIRRRRITGGWPLQPKS